MLESIYSVFVPSGLMLLMFGMGLQLAPMDWARLAKVPGRVLVGLFGQFVLLPAIALALLYILSLPLAIAAGILILAVCPGGVVSNSVVFLARADVALSVTLTAVSSLLALLTVPLVLDLGLELIQRGEDLAREGGRVELPFWGTLRQLLVLVFVPILAGMTVRALAPQFALRADRSMRVLGVIVLVVLLFGSFAIEFEFFIQHLSEIWSVLLALNLATLAGGYAVAWALRMDRIRRHTIAIEVGIQNVALGVLIAVNLLQQPEWAVVPSVYGLVMMGTAFVLIYFGSRIRR